MAILDKIKVGSTTYDVADSYARARLEGISTSWAISYSDTLDTTADYYVNAIDGTHKTPAELGASNCKNSVFNSTDATISPTGTSNVTYLILFDGYDRRGGKAPYFLYMSDLLTGDTVYVVQENVPDRWFSTITVASPNTYNFVASESKSQVGSYVTKGTYTTGNPSSGSKTGSAGGETINTSQQAAYTATGTSSITYKKSNSTTQNGGGETITGTAKVSYKKAASETGSAGGHTVTVKITPSGSIGGSQTVSAHSHTVNVSSSDTAIKSLNKSTVAAKATVSGTTLDLSGGVEAYTSVASTFTAVKGITLNTAGGVTINGSNFSFTGTEGSGSATVAAHTHSVGSSDADASGTATVTTSAHSHGITLTDTTVSGSASIAIAAHSHSVTTSSHTHDVGNHTHNVTL